MKYPSSEKILEIAMKEYEFEDERKNSIDNKAGLLLAAVVAALAVFIETFSQSDKCLNVVGVLIIVFGFASCLLLVIVLFPRKYERISETSLVDERIHLMASDELSYSMTKVLLYKKAVNADINSKKSKTFFCSSLATIAFIVIMFVYLISFRTEVNMADKDSKSTITTDETTNEKKAATVDQAVDILIKSRPETYELNTEKEEIRKKAK